jgi:hypothetical protein
MKVIIEYTMLHGRAPEKGKPASAVKAIRDQRVAPMSQADFPVHRFEYGVEDASDAGRTIVALLGLSMPPS